MMERNFDLGPLWDLYPRRGPKQTLSNLGVRSAHSISDRPLFFILWSTFFSFIRKLDPWLFFLFFLIFVPITLELVSTVEDYTISFFSEVPSSTEPAMKKKLSSKRLPLSSHPITWAHSGKGCERADRLDRKKKTSRISTLSIQWVKNYTWWYF